jgi:alpha-2-macroglobulin
MQKPVSGLTLGKDNGVVFTKQGSGNLYYNMNLHYFLPYTEIASLDRGITILREYDDASGNPITDNKIKAAGFIRVKLTIVVNDTRHKVLIEDKLPAGLQAFNENLNGSVTLPKPAKKPNLGTLPLYYDRMEYRDDRVVYFTDLLSPGVYEVSYLASATTVGKYHRPPAQAYEMYMPDVMGHTDGGWFEVTE